MSTIKIKRNTTLTTIKQLNLQTNLNLYIFQSFHRMPLNKIDKPRSEWRCPRNIRNKFQKVENMSKTKKSTSYSSFTKVTYNWIYFSTRLPVNFFKTSNQCRCVSKSTTKFMYKDCHLKAIKVTLKTINVPKFYSMVFPVYSSHQLICPLIYSLVTTMGFWYIVQCCWWIGNR